jgi:hypothetical protein
MRGTPQVELVSSSETADYILHVSGELVRVYPQMTSNRD